jgi:uncharacterized protein involved in exopolysaccharide biosynthesis
MKELSLYQEDSLRQLSEPPSFSLRNLLTIVFRHSRLIAFSFFGILSGAILIAALQPDQYEASMKILVKRERMDPVVTPANTQPQPAAEVNEEQLNSEAELIKSRDLLEKVVLACGLQNGRGNLWSPLLKAIGRGGHGTVNKNARIAEAIRTLDSQLKANVIKKTNMIGIGYSSLNPELAARVLTTLSNLYLEKHVAVHRPPGALEFFQQQREQYQEQLSAAEASLAAFSQRTGVVSASLQKETALQKVSEFEVALRQNEAAIAESEQRRGLLDQLTSATPNRIITQVKDSDDAPLISGIRSNLLALEQKRTELLAKFAPGYRLVQQVDTQIAQTRDALASAEKAKLHEETTDRNTTYEWARQELEKTKTELAGLHAREAATALAVASYTQRSRSLEQQQIVQENLTRTMKATEESYLMYLRKEEEARTSDALDRDRMLNVAIAEPPSVPALPSNRRSRTVLFGALLALQVSVSLAFFSERLVTTFRTPAELQSVLDVPVLAALPAQRGNADTYRSEKRTTSDAQNPNSAN